MRFRFGDNMWVRTNLFALTVGLLVIISSTAFTEAQDSEQHMEYQGDGVIMMTSHTVIEGLAATSFRTYIDMEHGNNDGELTSSEVETYVSMILNMGRLPTQNYKLDGYTGLSESIGNTFQGIETDDVNSTEPFTSTDVVMFYMSEGSGVEHTFSFTFTPYLAEYLYLNISFEIPEGWKKYAHHMTINMGEIDPQRGGVALQFRSAHQLGSPCRAFGGR